MYFLTELQVRPDGIVNSSIKGYSSMAIGLAQYYSRAAVAVASKSFLSVALTLQAQEGDIVKNEHFNTLYEEHIDDNAEGE